MRHQCVPVAFAADWLLVSVKDTGPGISREERGRFAQSACLPSINANGSGMGLGLDIVHRSAVLLGHEIDAASVPGFGTCVTLRCPWLDRLRVSHLQLELHCRDRGVWSEPVGIRHPISLQPPTRRKRTDRQL
jgi:Histidine kinase-, DNA gyrase B-, and HSP90-like ATPase